MCTNRSLSLQARQVVDAGAGKARLQAGRRCGDEQRGLPLVPDQRAGGLLSGLYITERRKNDKRATQRNQGQRFKVWFVC